MNNPTRSAVLAGRRVHEFLSWREVLTPADIVTYLQLRKVRRFRVVVLPGAVLICVPPDKLLVMTAAMPARPVGVSWFVLPLRWWQRGRRVQRLDTQVARIG